MGITSLFMQADERSCDYMTNVFLYEPLSDRRAIIIAELLSAQMIPMEINDNFFQRDLSLLNENSIKPQPFLMASSSRTLDHIRHLRASGCDNPILVVRQARDSHATAAALDVGADDDIVAPVYGLEIKSRISSITRRASAPAPDSLSADSISIGEVTAFFDGRDPEVSGRRVRLSPREHAVFQYLITNSPKVVSRIAVYDAVYSLADHQPFDKVIDVYICKIRKKISRASKTGYHYIETVFGRGYKFSTLQESSSNVTVKAHTVSSKSFYRSCNNHY